MNPNRNEYDEQNFDDASRLIKGRQYFQRRPKTAADLVAQLMARKGYGQLAAADELQTVWQTVAGDVWRNQTLLGSIRRGVLEIVVANSTLLQRLEFEKKQLLTALQQQLPQNQIKNIRFRIGNIKQNG